MADTRSVVLLTSSSIGWADVRASLAMLTEITIADEIRDPDALVATVKRVEPDAVLMPTQIDDRSVMPLLATIREGPARVPLIVLFAQFLDPSELAAALRAGVSGYIIFSDVETDDFPAELRSLIVSGVMLLSRSTHEPLRRLLASCQVELDPRAPSLSEREQLILRGLARGLTRKEIALDRQISLRTVNREIDQIQRYLNVGTTAALLVEATRKGLI